MSGKQFDRMSVARKSLLHVQASQTVEENTDTMRRRTRSRKPRGKRRNTVAVDGKEVLEAVQAYVFLFIYILHSFVCY